MELHYLRHVRDYKLETRFPRKRETVHIYDDPDAPPFSPPRLECWKSEKRPIGVGGQAKVFLQTCTSGGRHHTQRAVKVVPLESGSAKKRYIRELEIMVKFSHDRYSKYFVKLLGWYEDRESLFMGMEYMPAGDLHSYQLSRPALAEDESRQITSQVLRGLQFMHTHGFAHRDIKPQNVLIQQSPTSSESGPWWVKLSDFGISKRQETLTSGASTVIGTLEYMAPELFDRTSAPNINYLAADMWAVGIMTYWILTKAHMFPSQRDFYQYETDPIALFPRGPLNELSISSYGQAFIRALVKPKPEERVNVEVAMKLSWSQVLVPNETSIPDEESDSASSSGRSLFDGDIGVSGPFSAAWSEETVVPRESPDEVQSQALPKPDMRAEAEADAEDQSPLVVLRELEDRDANDMTPLLRAAESGNVAEASRLLNMGADITAQPDFGPNGQKTPFLLAMEGGHAAMAKILIQRGANEHATFGHRAYPSRPRCLGVDWQSIAEITHILDNLAHGQGVSNAAEEHLIYAVATGNIPMAELLFRKNLFMYRVDFLGVLLLIAAGYGNEGIARLLLEKGADVNGGPQSLTPIMAAVHHDQPAMVTLLVEHGANVDRRFGKRGPLDLAMELRLWRIVKVLVEKAALSNESKNMVLSSAMEAQGLRMAKLLINHGADPNLRLLTTGSGPMITMLHWAVVLRDLNFCDILCDKGAYLETKDPQGRTPLCLAVARGQQDIIQLLCDRGANIKDGGANSPLDTARTIGNPAVVALLAKNLLEREEDSAKDCSGRKGQSSVPISVKLGRRRLSMKDDARWKR